MYPPESCSVTRVLRLDYLAEVTLLFTHFLPLRQTVISISSNNKSSKFKGLILNDVRIIKEVIDLCACFKLFLTALIMRQNNGHS